MNVLKYWGENLKQIKFLLGGIGTGNISLEGRGSLTDWEIFNRPSKGNEMYGNFVALRVEKKRNSFFRIVARKPFSPFEGAHGFKNTRMEGAPHFKECEFTNFFPFAVIDFIDRESPVKVSLTAWTPFIPLDIDNSSLPIAIFTYRLKNCSREKLNIFLAFSMMNPVGTDGTEKLNTLGNSCFGQNINNYIETENLRGLFFTSKKYEKDNPRFGNISLLTDAVSVSYKNQWEKGGWWNEFRSFWKEFKNGDFEKVAEKESPDGETYFSSLGVKETISPGEETKINFYLSWYFPNRINYWGLDEEMKGKIFKNYYAEKFSNSIDVSKYFVKNRDYIERESRKFAERFFSQSLPESFLTTISAQLNTLRSNTFFINSDGKFYGFEGCSDNSGCCPLNCTHVHNYDFTTPFLFPSLSKTQREVDYLFNTDENGYMAFRTNLPLGIKIWKFKPAADGQMGTIIKLYREWKISGDDEFLKKLYPSAKKTMVYAFENWDKNRDGLMEEQQHNTYDIEFYGENPFTSFIYLAALKAMKEISKYMKDNEFSSLCNEIYEKGKRNIVEKLWNKKYFIQKCSINPVPPYQFLNGCLSMQLLGQFFSDMVNLGNLIDKKYIKKTLFSIFKNNFKTDLSNHLNYMRIYAIGEEKGLLICTWEEGERPEIPMPYCDEVFTGEELAFASLLLKRGFLKESIKIVETIDERYDGIKRNPFNHMECGYHYARGLSGWGLILSYLGFWTDNVKKELFFNPLIFRKNFSIFFSSGTGWGTYNYRILSGREVFKIEIDHGFMETKKINLSYWKNRKTTSVKVLIDGKEVKNNFSESKNKISVEFDDIKRAEKSIEVSRHF